MNELILSKLEVGRLDVELIQREALPASLTAAAHTILISEIRNGIIRMDPTAARAWTAPTAALAVAGAPGCKVGDSLDFSIINEGSTGDDETITVSAGSDGTLIGFGAVENNATTHDAFSSGSGLFRLQFTTVTGDGAYNLIRLA
tara:strand:- start:42 stop:476 length:435 start_codon:yes stop_codon:yes gene_type:complete